MRQIMASVPVSDNPQKFPIMEEIKPALLRAKKKPIGYTLAKDEDSEYYLFFAKNKNSPSLSFIKKSAPELKNPKPVFSGFLEYKEGGADEGFCFVYRKDYSKALRVITKIFKEAGCMKYLPVHFRPMKETEDVPDDGEGVDLPVSPPPGTGDGGQSRPEADTGKAGALAAWSAAREKAIAQLKAIGQAIVAEKHPEARNAAILIQAIVKNLTPSPDTRQAVTELMRYLKTDDIIDDIQSPNPFGINVNIREPLLAALDGLMAVCDN